jgi:lysyl-tRNA synthetase, class II
MDKVRAVGLSIAAALLGILVSAAAIGTLYLVRAPTTSWPGPAIADALPLDELPHHDAVNVFAFLLVWGSAAVLLAAVARWRGAERLAASVALGLGLMAFLYPVTGLCLYIVRGLGRASILHVPARVRAVYIPPALAGTAGALLGRHREARTRGPKVLGLLVGMAGGLDILSAITPELRERLQLLERFAPRPIPPLASAAVVPIGLILILIARGLVRRKRRAWVLAMWLLAGSSFLHLLKGLDYEEAMVTGLLAVALFARRSDFSVRGDPEGRPRLALRAAVLALLVYAYGAVALWLNQALADRPFSLAFAAEETNRALVGLTVTGSSHLQARLGDWFPLSVLLIGLVAVTYVLGSWLAPWRYRPRSEVPSWETTRSLVAHWGVDTLAPFLLRADKSYFFDAERRAVLGYTVLAGVAIVSGDPVGPPDAARAVFEDFLRFARHRDWRVTVLGASERWLGTYEAQGLRWMYHGDEAVIRTDRFSLEGRHIRKVRQAVHRVERAGYRWEARWAEDVDPVLRTELEAIVGEWRGSEPQKGFVMAFDSPFRLEGRAALFVIGRDEHGCPQGFLHFAVCEAGAALSLSSMPKRRGTPNGFNEWLITRAVHWGHDQGFGTLSLNFAPFAALLDPATRLAGFQRLERDALRAVKSRLHLQLDNLLMFCGQFQPTWQPRFVVFERWGDLPRVGLAALAAEGYLPVRLPVRKMTMPPPVLADG